MGKSAQSKSLAPRTRLSAKERGTVATFFQ